MYELNMTNATAENLLVQTSQQVQVLFPLILLFEFLVIALFGMYSNKRQTGYSNVPMWMSIAGLVTTTSSFFLYLVPGLIPLAVPITTMAITFVCALWFLLSENE